MAFVGERYQVAWLAAITILVGVAAAFAFRVENAGSIKLVLIYGGVTTALAIVGMVRAWRRSRERARSDVAKRCRR